MGFMSVAQVDTWGLFGCEENGKYLKDMFGCMENFGVPFLGHKCVENSGVHFFPIKTLENSGIKYTLKSFNTTRTQKDRFSFT